MTEYYRLIAVLAAQVSRQGLWRISFFYFVCVPLFRMPLILDCFVIDVDWHVSCGIVPSTAQVGWLGLWVGGHPVFSLHSSNEPGELSQWPWSRWQHHKHCRWLLLLSLSIIGRHTCLCVVRLLLKQWSTTSDSCRSQWEVNDVAWLGIHQLIQ